MRPEVHPLSIVAALIGPKLYAQESARAGGRNVCIDHGVAHDEILYYGGAAVEQQALAPRVFHNFGVPLQIPTRGVRGNQKRLVLRASRSSPDEQSSGQHDREKPERVQIR
jgi:hypothetical protein